ncbi:MAG: glycosyltransferase [Nocardiopsaceae bacterium]|nr:glycosyltransferase [Nocardiopsaceae bacterium]
MIRSVGVIIPAHDEQDLLPSCLASMHLAIGGIRRSRGLPVRLVVVADACQDRTAEVARQAGAVVVSVDARCVGAARAAGAREVLRRTRHLDPRDVWLATTDADTLVPARWLREQARYADLGWDAVAGTVRVENWRGHPPGVRSAFAERYDAGSGPHPHVHGANLGFRAAAYLRAGGFPDVPTGEDHALVPALHSAGARVLRTRALPVVTSARREARAPLGFSHYLAELGTTVT